MSSPAFAADGVNAVIGDESWVARFGAMPDDSAEEDVRLRVHLEYVEARLRASTPAGLSEEQRAERARNLDRLRAYIERGEFPRNFEVQGRRPHFIDDEGRICAVGYLIEQSAGREVAEAINRAHEWDFIPEIRGIDAWVEASGLTKTELAMIQPSYDWQRPGRPMPPPPPPPDDYTQQRRIIVAALAMSADDVQACADRFDVWGERVAVSVSVGRYGVIANVALAGTRAFRSCVKRTVEAEVASRLGSRWRWRQMSVGHTYNLDSYWEEEEPIVDWGDREFSQPPPR